MRPNGPYNPREQALWFGLLRVRSPLLAESLTCFLFLQVLRWFTSLRCLPRAYVFSTGYSRINRSGFPHSEIPGSKPACGSPGLIAACHVLHRLLVPRHSPYALSSLTKCFTYTLRVCDQRTTDCGIFSCQRIRRRGLPPLRRDRLVTACQTLFRWSVRLRSLTRASAKRCSKRTTVCRIFSCQRPSNAITRIRFRTRSWLTKPARLRCLQQLRRATLAWLANRSSRALASVSEGWWRIPGSNR